MVTVTASGLEHSIELKSLNSMSLWRICLLHLQQLCGKYAIKMYHTRAHQQVNLLTACSALSEHVHKGLSCQDNDAVVPDSCSPLLTGDWVLSCETSYAEASELGCKFTYNHAI